MLRQRSIRTAALVFIYFLAGLPAVPATTPATLPWQTNLEDAKRIAAQTNRLVMVHFWSPSCKACLELEKSVFSQPQVQQFIDSRFVPIKINADEAPTTTKRYGITQLPTDLILTPGAPNRWSFGMSARGRCLHAATFDRFNRARSGHESQHRVCRNCERRLGSTPCAKCEPGLNARQFSRQFGPAVGYSGQWTAQKSNAAVEQAYSDSRYSEFFQRYSAAAPQQSASAK